MTPDLQRQLRVRDLIISSGAQPSRRARVSATTGLPCSMRSAAETGGTGMPISGVPTPWRLLAFFSRESPLLQCTTPVHQIRRKMSVAFAPPKPKLLLITVRKSPLRVSRKIGNPSAAPSSLSIFADPARNPPFSISRQ